MRGWARAGLAMFVAGVAGLGLTAVVGIDVVKGLEPLADEVPGKRLIGFATGVLLLLLAVCLPFVRARRRAALVLGWVFALWVVVLHLPHLVKHPADGGGWTTAWETAALAGAAWVLAAAAGATVLRGTGLRAGLLGRVLFGLSLPVFGVLHFVYARYVASVIPDWIPGHPGWAYATGIAHAAAGLAILSGVRRRLAAILEGCMFASWLVLLHAPRVAGGLDHRNEWTSLFIATAMAGGAWLIAGASSPTAEPASGESRY